MYTVIYIQICTERNITHNLHFNVIQTLIFKRLFWEPFLVFICQIPLKSSSIPICFFNRIYKNKCFFYRGSIINSFDNTFIEFSKVRNFLLHKDNTTQESKISYIHNWISRMNKMKNFLCHSASESYLICTMYRNTINNMRLLHIY